MSKFEGDQNVNNSELENRKEQERKLAVRPYNDRDLEQVIKIYQSSFAEPPWNEYMKCSSCGIEYGTEETKESKDLCKNCHAPLELIEYWDCETVKEEIKFALSQPDSTVLIAEDNEDIVGILWGYIISFEKYPFLKGRVENNANYWDTIAVKKNKRLGGIAVLLGNKYLECVKRQGLSQIVGRIREEKERTHLLVKKFGFSIIPEQKDIKTRIYDPNFPGNVYLTKFLNK